MISDKPVITWVSEGVTITAGATWLTLECEGFFQRLRGAGPLGTFCDLLDAGLYDNRCTSCRLDEEMVCAIDPERDSINLFIGSGVVFLSRRTMCDLQQWLRHCLGRPLVDGDQLARLAIEPQAGRQAGQTVLRVRDMQLRLAEAEAQAVGRRLLAAAGGLEQPADGLDVLPRGNGTIFTVQLRGNHVTLCERDAHDFNLILNTRGVDLGRGALAAIACDLAAGVATRREERAKSYLPPQENPVQRAMDGRRCCTGCPRHDGTSCSQTAGCDALVILANLG